MVQADKRLGLFEWTLHQILLRHLRPQFEQVKPPQIQYYGLQQLGQPCSVLLSALARASQSDDEAAFDSGADELPEVPLELLPPDACRLNTLEQALDAVGASRAEAAGAARRRLCGLHLCRRGSPCRRGRIAAGGLRHARLPDAAALAGQKVSQCARGAGLRVRSVQPRDADFRPSASLAALALRADLLRRLREFFYARGFVEVETPLVSAEIIPELHIEPIRLESGAFLQASPELHMKRLLAAGAEAIFQVTRSFRAGRARPAAQPGIHDCRMVSRGRRHDGRHRLARRADAIAARHATGEPNNVRRRISSERSTSARTRRRQMNLSAATTAAGISAPAEMDRTDRDEWLNLLLSHRVEPQLGRDSPEIIYHYPASQASLAKIVRNEAGHDVAERFELYYRGIELANGFHELADAAELRRAVRSRQRSARTPTDGTALPLPERLLAAVDHGLPECTGVALGFDRLAMLASGGETIDEVLAFPSGKVGHD